MKKISFTGFTAIIGSLLFFYSSAHALDVGGQPRIETGIMSYSFEQSAVSKSVPTDIIAATGFNMTQQEVEYDSTMGYIGGGATLFFNRFFVDLSGQYTFEGSDRVGVIESIYNESDDQNMNLSTFTSVDADYDVQLDRKDHAISLGYAVTSRFSVFAGYKWAEVDLETIFGGPFTMVAIDNAVFSGQATGEGTVDFKYQGPFVGVAHGWPVESTRFFQGLISFNAGIARLGSELNRSSTILTRVDTINGVGVEPSDLPETTLIEKIKGDTWGLTLGLAWRGMTPIEALSYSVGISGHRYQFDSKDSFAPEISETAVTYKLGLSYLF